MSIIRDVVTEMSVTNESAVAFGQSPGSAVLGIRGSPLPAAPLTQTPAGDAPEKRPSAGFSLLQSEDIRKSLRDMEKHVCNYHILNPGLKHYQTNSLRNITSAQLTYL